MPTALHSTGLLPRVLLLLGLLLPLVSGCLDRTAPSRFYLLEPALPAETRPANSKGATAATNCGSVGVGPVELPGYVDREQMVVRLGNNTVAIEEFDRWAEPLDKAIVRTLAANLATLQCASPVLAHPWPEGVRPEWQVTLQFTRHDCTPDASCVVAASWAVLDDDRDVVAMGASRHVTPLSGTAFPAMARALSTSHAALSRDIAAAIPQPQP